MKKMENKFAIAAAAPPGTRHQRRRRTVGLRMAPDTDTMPVGKDARQFPNNVTDTGEKIGESFMEHMFTLVLRTLAGDATQQRSSFANPHIESHR